MKQLQIGLAKAFGRAQPKARTGARRPKQWVFDYQDGDELVQACEPTQWEAEAYRSDLIRDGFKCGPVTPEPRDP